MTIDKYVRLFAGLMTLLSIALTYYVHPYWVWLTVFVGANLAQSGLTNICPLASILKKLGVPEGVSCS
jgi:Inner membrane protein YgaP-like, transmembrane domain